MQVKMIALVLRMERVECAIYISCLQEVYEEWKLFSQIISQVFDHREVLGCWVL